MRKLPVKLYDLTEAIAADSEDWSSYLDLETGEVIWVWAEDKNYAVTMNADADENRRLREAVDEYPDRYAAIPEASVIDDNRRLQDFLNSDWTDDKALAERAAAAYDGSVGRWKKNHGYDMEILHAWIGYEEEADLQQALDFLKELNIEAIPTDDE